MTDLTPHPIAPPVPDAASAADAAMLRLESFSYEPRGRLLHALQRGLDRAGCWQSEEPVGSPAGAELRFDLQLSGIVELYAALLAAGLEMTRAGHAEITSLCTVRRFRGRGAARSLVSVQLTVAFLDELSVASVLNTGTAFA